MVDTAGSIVYSEGMETTTTRCQSCGQKVRRSSTPTIDGQGRKSFLRHIDTGFTACAPEDLKAANVDRRARTIVVYADEVCGPTFADWHAAPESLKSVSAAVVKAVIQSGAIQ